MNIFIDESGNFARPADGSHAPSLVAALVLPHVRTVEVFRRFRRLKRSWGVGDTEVKGKDLPAERVSEVVQLLLSFDGLVVMSLCDPALESAETIARAQADQAAKFIEHLTPEHKPGIVKEMSVWKRDLERLSAQLWFQFALMTDLIPDAFQDGTVYHVLRVPAELGQFHWEIDPKDKKRTTYEKLWSKVVLAAMQHRSLSGEKSLGMIGGADYSHMAKFYDDKPQVSQHLQNAYHLPAGDDRPRFDLKKVLGDLSFPASETSLGLQLADIVVSATRRALMGTLGRSGWGEIGMLFLRQDRPALRVTTFPGPGRVAGGRLPPTPYDDAVVALNATARTAGRSVVP